MFWAIVAFCAGVWITRWYVREAFERLKDHVRALNARIEQLTSEVADLSQPEASQRRLSEPSTTRIPTHHAPPHQEDLPEPTRERDYKPISHLVVTAGGEQWIPERLPKDDDRAPDSLPPTVSSSVSKPVGYRLLDGYQLLQEADPADDASPDDRRPISSSELGMIGFQLVDDDELKDKSDPVRSTQQPVASPSKPSQDAEPHSVNSEPPEEPSYRPIEHLVVTVRGDRWVTERLPKNEDRVPDPAPPSVSSLISKPVGYRLIAGHHLLQGNDPSDKEE